MKKYAIILLALVLCFCSVACKKEKAVTTEEQTSATTVTTTATTTTEPEEPEELPVPTLIKFNVYIDDGNKRAFDRLEWEALSGDFDGYEINYGMPENYYPNTPEEWFLTETVDNSGATSYDLEMQYATGSDIAMARIRTYKDVNGTKVYSDWSKVINLDFENKIHI